MRHTLIPDMDYKTMIIFDSIKKNNGKLVREDIDLVAGIMDRIEYLLKNKFIEIIDYNKCRNTYRILK